MPERLTVAVVGCGIGRTHILEGYLPNSDRYRVVALCDVNAERLSALAGEFDIERRCTAFDEVLAMDDIDVVDICTPASIHYGQIMAALDRKSTRLNSSH